MRGKAHLLCSSLSNFAPDETKLPCLILLQGYVVVGNPASPKSRKSLSFALSVHEFCVLPYRKAVTRPFWELVDDMKVERVWAFQTHWIERKHRINGLAKIHQMHLFAIIISQVALKLRCISRPSFLFFYLMWLLGTFGSLRSNISVIRSQHLPLVSELAQPSCHLPAPIDTILYCEGSSLWC